jgi:PKHD-type hydroxylase
VETNVITIEGFLSDESCARIKKEIAKVPFEDGLKTAGVRMAANVKRNLQMDPVKGQHITDELKMFILNDKRLKETVYPKDIGRIFINRYDAGMEYGIHSDSPMMGSLRTDLSFTLFLEDPSEYDGGDLVMHYSHGTVTAKPPKGAIVLYSTGVMHRVEKVTRGSRLACVGWIQSFIREETKREILRELNFVMANYITRNGHDFLTDLFLKNVGNLERLWSE